MEFQIGHKFRVARTAMLSLCFMLSACGLNPSSMSQATEIGVVSTVSQLPPSQSTSASPATLAPPLTTTATPGPLGESTLTSATHEGFDPLISRDLYSLKLYKIEPVFREAFDYSAFPTTGTPLSVSDVNNDGQNEIVVGLSVRVGCLTGNELDCSSVLQWNGVHYQSLPFDWQMPEGWDCQCDYLGNIGSVFVGDVTGSGSNILVLSQIGPKASYQAYTLVAQLDAKKARVIYTEFAAPKSFALLPGQSPPLLLVSYSLGGLLKANPSAVNRLDTLQIADGTFQRRTLLEDRNELLYAGNLPGLAGYYVLREQIFDFQEQPLENAIQAYEWISGQLTSIDNPLPVNKQVQAVGPARLNGEDGPSLVLLRTAPKCEFAGTDCSGQPNDGQQAIEVYRPEGGRYRLLSRIVADPLGVAVARLTVGDLDNDGYDEIVTSKGIVYKWEAGQFVMSRALQMVGESQWITCDCMTQLASVIADPDNDGKNELVMLAPIQHDEEDRYTSTVFVVKASGAP